MRPKTECVKKCTLLCPACSRICNGDLSHSEMHHCDFHEWIYNASHEITIIILKGKGLDSAKLKDGKTVG